MLHPELAVENLFQVLWGVDKVVCKELLFSLQTALVECPPSQSLPTSWCILANHIAKLEGKVVVVVFHEIEEVNGLGGGVVGDTGRRNGRVCVGWTDLVGWGSQGFWLQHGPHLSTPGYCHSYCQSAVEQGGKVHDIFVKCGPGWLKQPGPCRGARDALMAEFQM